MSDRVVPTEPGWWWVRTQRSAGEVVRVTHRLYRGEPDGLCVPDDDGEDVEWCGYDWLAPVATPDEVAALRADVERMRVLLRLADGCDRSADGDDPWDVVVALDEAVLEESCNRSWSDTAAALRAIAGGGS